MRLLLPLLLAGCGSDLPAASFIDKLRVLAVQAEPPEVAPGTPVSVQALVVQPIVKKPEMGTPDALWLACQIPPGTLQALPCGVGQQSPSLIGSGLAVSYTPDGSSLQDGKGEVLLTIVVADQGTAADCLSEIQKHNGIPQNPDHCVVALKRLPLTSGAIFNHNPLMTALTLGMMPLDGTAQFPPSGDGGGSTLKLQLTRADDSAEKDAEGNYEALSVSWFTTSGKMDGARSQFDVAGCAAASDCPKSAPVADSTTSWIVPSAEQLAKTADASQQVHFWAVVRDDHGGVSWLDGAAVPKP